MITDFKSYPKMKDSGVNWVEQVPEHWIVTALRRKLQKFDGVKIGPFGSQLKLDQMSDSGYKVFGQGNVISNDFHRGTKFVDETKFEELSTCAIHPGDLLVTMMGTSGKCALVPEDAPIGIMDSHLLRIRTDSTVCANFAARLINEAPYVKEQIMVAGKGSIMHGLNSGIIKDLKLAFPPRSEQTAVARFLDYTDRWIQKYMRAKEKLIALLDEYKQSLIHQAVTGQIDVRTGKPYPEYMDSGVEWLGEVPEHWKSRRVKHLAAGPSGGIQMGPFGTSLTQLQSENTGFKLYGQENTISGDFRRGSRWLSRAQFNDLRRYELLPGDVVLTRKGSIGKCRLLPQDLGRGIMDSDTIRLRLCSDIVDSRFLVLLLHLASYLRLQLESVQRGAVLGGLNTATIANLQVMLPSIGEQLRILSVVSGWIDQCRSATDAVSLQIKHLSEYRTRLIADVVTGRLDVREAAADLPDTNAVAWEDGVDTIQTESHSHSAERDIAEEANG